MFFDILYYIFENKEKVAIAIGVVLVLSIAIYTISIKENKLNTFNMKNWIQKGFVCSNEGKCFDVSIYCSDNKASNITTTGKISFGETSIVEVCH